MKEDEKNNKNAALSQDELRKMRRVSYIKMAAMVGFVIAMIAFSSMHMPIKQMTA